jgi:hypothetical protein
MTNHSGGSQAQIHPAVVWAIAGLTLVFVLAAWGFVASGYAGYLLAVVSGLLAFAVGLPVVLLRAGRPDDGDRRRGLFGDWAACPFDTCTGPVKGAFAAVEVLLPIAAVAFGMVAFDVTLRLA